MIDLNEKQIREYFSRSYAKVDGLWFVKVEEKYGFDAALDIDEEVWKVMPKIQARLLKKWANREKGIIDLLECLSTKLNIEGYVFKTDLEDDQSGFLITIQECPWKKIMVQSGRESLASKIGQRICGSEYAVWAKEFGADIFFSLESDGCGDNQACALRFSVSS